ncbi:MAG TPA: hypothetical protein VGC14_10870, partial [Rhizobium sp.]
FTDATVIYIGRSDAYLQAMSPRVLHLQALVPHEGEVAAATAPAAPAAATKADAKKANAPSR